MKKLIKTKCGQGLVEVIIAMGILLITSTAAMTVVVSSKNLIYMSEGQTKATALAQEGIEIVRNNRNVGCDFNSLSAEPSATSCHVVWSDMVDNTSADNTKNNVKPISDFAGKVCADANQIDGFSGFTRTIYLKDLSTETWLTNAGFNSTYDARSKYFYITVKVSWTDKTGPRSTEISTIMLKKWKD
jgi:type II secretory pathway pseudopilin PulG